MFQVLHRSEQRKGAIAAVEFEGASSGAGVSFFLGNLMAGQGPGLHHHPYAETCVVLSGQAAMVVDGEEITVGAGDVIVIGAGTSHGFRATGDQRLDMIGIHASGRFIIETKP